MEHVRWTSRPNLHNPVLIAAFEGWNDAGDASSNAVRWLHDRWGAEPFAHIDPEEFFDFSATRPRVRLDEGRQREIVWPAFEFSTASIPGTDTEVVLLLGTEPQLRWRTFCEQVVAVAGRVWRPAGHHPRRAARGRLARGAGVGDRHRLRP